MPICSAEPAQIRWLSIYLVLVILLLAGGHGNCASHSLDYIYIDSSVDEAAGGHAAIRLGATVFHFQFHDDGRFLLVKDDWADFRHEYSNLQNRSLAIASVPLSSTSFTAIKNSFLSRYLVQEERFSSLLRLREIRKLLRSTLSGRGQINVRGLGFFSKDLHGDTNAKALQERLIETLGRTFFDELRSRVIKEIMVGHNDETQRKIGLAELNYYRSVNAYAKPIERLLDGVKLLEAVAVLQNCYALRQNMLLEAHGTIGELHAAELQKFVKFREVIFNSIIGLLKSDRPDRGEPLLVQIARYHALSLSLQKKRIVTLYPFSEKSQKRDLNSLKSVLVHKKRNESNRILGAESYFVILQQERIHDASEAISYFLQQERNDEITYNLIENTFGRLWEIDRAAAAGDFLRTESGRLLPCSIGQVDGSRYLTPSALKTQLETLDDLILQFSNALQSLYGYNLISKNCVTELFATVYSAFPDQKTVARELGGYFEPGEQLSFIPFKSFTVVETSFPVEAIEILPSRRKRYLDELARQNHYWSYLQESNTVTSTLYYPWEKDSLFLFFTDDILLLRPVYGGLNLFYGTLGSLTGLLTAPLDHGKLLKRSGKGMLFSLPELLFINIRKGSFPSSIDGS